MKNSTILFIIIGIIALLFFSSGNQPLSFFPQSLSPVQYIGDTSSLSSGISPSSTAILGNYKIVTEQFDSYIYFPNFKCGLNTCNGVLNGVDKYGCPMYLSGADTTIRTCSIGASSGYHCAGGTSGCGYFSGSCEPATGGCTSVGAISVSCSGSGAVFLGDICRGESSDVTYTASVSCYLSSVSCGGMDLGTTQSLGFSCANKYKVYYNNVLVDDIIGYPYNKELVIGELDKYYLNGAEVIDSNDADLIVRFHQSDSYRDSPRACLFTTNEYDLPINQQSFDIITTKEENNIKVKVINNYGIQVNARIKILYSLETVIGVVNKEDIRIIDIPAAGAEYLIPITEELTTENIFAEVSIDILFSKNVLSGINIPSIDCLKGNDYGTEGAKLVSFNNCDYVKIGNVKENFQIGARSGDVPVTSPAPEVESKDLMYYLSELWKFILSIILIPILPP